MRQVGSYEAKSKLPALLRAVASGERIVITRSGQPVADLVPHRATRRDVEQTIARIRELRQKVTLGDEDLKSMIEEGRR